MEGCKKTGSSTKFARFLIAQKYFSFQQRHLPRRRRAEEPNGKEAESHRRR